MNNWVYLLLAIGNYLIFCFDVEYDRDVMTWIYLGTAVVFSYLYHINRVTTILNGKDELRTSHTPKQWVIHVVRRLLSKEYCIVCGQELTEIRGRHPEDPRRKVCACCATEKLEWQEEYNNTRTYKSNYE